MSVEIERELDWNDTIKNDGNEYVLLPEGDYSFTVESFERGRHNGSEKLPPCNKAILKIRIDSPQGSTVVTHNLFLHSKTEGMLSSFFAAIGLKKKGESLVMNWNLVAGSKGKAKIGIHKYTNDTGEERTYNDIKKFYQKEESATPSWKAGGF